MAERTAVMTSRGQPAIQLIDVTKRYGKALALDNVSLEIAAGEFFCLLGPSGCGKTTTLNLIGGFLPLTSGELRIHGQRVNDIPPHKRNVNTVFQNYALFPHLSVFDNVAFGLRMEAKPKAEILSRVGEVLDLVGLAEFGDRYPAQLSGGQQQRVALARALVKRPAVLLLDEPLGALDKKLRKQMQVELSSIHRQVGTTFVFVTHDQEEALSMATRIAVMNAGRVKQVASPREIYEKPVDRLVADFIGESNFLEGVFSSGDGGHLRLRDGTEVPIQLDHRSSLSDGLVTLMVRPESIGVGGDAPPAAAVLSGSVIDLAYMGSHTRITLATSAGTLVALHFHSLAFTDRSSHVAVKQEVKIWWDPRNATIVPEAQPMALIAQEETT
jgi:spermidine/putrescine transport system ATP-binding protein